MYFGMQNMYPHSAVSKGKELDIRKEQTRSNKREIKSKQRGDKKGKITKEDKRTRGRGNERENKGDGQK